MRSRRPRQLIYTILFNPLGYVSGIEQAQLLNQLSVSPLVTGSSFPDYRVYRGQKSWLLELPRGLFANNLTRDVTWEEELAARDALFERIRREEGEFYDRRTGIIVHDDVPYYRRAILDRLRIYMKPNEFIVAAYTFLSHVEKDPTIIKGRRKVPPLSERPLVNGRRSRGAAWAEWEDTVLRQWFGLRDDGSRFEITASMWEVLLKDKLKGQRSRGSVMGRIKHLNRELKKTLLVDGYIPREHLNEYRKKFLGQRFKMPNKRPRLHGTYYSAKPEEGQG